MRKALPRSTHGLVAIALAALLAACGANGDAAPAADGDTNGAGASADAITIVGTEFSFDPDNFTVPADTPVEVVLDNQGVIEHDITIDEAGVYIYADAGQTVSDEITLPAGTYTFYCDVPGHRESGMEGTVTAG